MRKALEKVEAKYKAIEKRREGGARPPVLYLPQ